MRTSNLALLAAFLLVAYPLTLPGGREYARVLVSMPRWIGGCAVLAFLNLNYVLRRLMELALRTPGAALRHREDPWA